MNVFLWILQALLALHTATGAVWKFSHSAEQTMPSLKAIPGGVWIAMGVVELLCSLGLVLPAFSKRLTGLASAAAGVIVAEMLLYSALHLTSGSAEYGPVLYWLAVAAVGGFIGYFRWVRR